MLESNSQSVVNLLKNEIDSWKPFIEALRESERNVVNDLIKKCWGFSNAIQSSKKNYLVEPFFLTILIVQGDQIRWLSTEVRRLREEIDVWKSKDGS